jgi:hypothetical protein
MARGSSRPSIWTPTVTYRIQLQNASASVLADIDPANLDVTAATQIQVNAGTATGVYVSPATLAAWTGVATALGYTPLNKAGDSATGLNIVAGNTAVNAAGYLGSPQNPQAGAYSFTLNDAGCTVYASGSTAQTFTIPANATTAFPIGTIISVLSTDSATVTIAPASGVTLNLGGAGTTGSRSLAQWGIATLIKVAANTWIVFGTNLT